MKKYILVFTFLAFSTCTGDKASDNEGGTGGNEGAGGDVSSPPAAGASADQGGGQQTGTTTTAPQGGNQLPDLKRLEMGPAAANGNILESIFTVASDFQPICLTAGRPSCAGDTVPKCFAMKEASEKLKTLNKDSTDPDFSYFVQNSVVACVNAADNSIAVNNLPKCSGGSFPICGLKEIDVSSSYFHVFCDADKQETSLTVKCPFGGWAVCSKRGRAYCVNDDGYMLSASGYRGSSYSIRCEDKADATGPEKKPFCLQAESSPFSSKRLAPPAPPVVPFSQ